MWMNIIKTSFRVLRRNKLHSLVTVTSLAVGMACFILFYFSWQYERSFDRFYPRSGNVYRVDRRMDMGARQVFDAPQQPALAPAVSAGIPEVEAATRWFVFSGLALVSLVIPSFPFLAGRSLVLGEIGAGSVAAGLAAFGTAQKRKETSVRKVLGASPGRISGTFFKEFVKPVVLSNLAFVAVGSHVFRAAGENPVDSLKYE